MNPVAAQFGRCAALALALSPYALSAQTLDEAVAAALSHDPAIAAAVADQDAAQARVDGAHAARLPTLVAQGSIGVGRIDPRNFFGLAAANVTPRVGQISAELPLYAGGKLTAGRDQAKAGLTASGAMLIAKRNQIMVETAAAYADVLSALENKASAAQLITETMEAERAAGLMYKAGASARTDLLSAQSRHAGAEAAAAMADAAIAAASARFAALTGEQPSHLDPRPAAPITPPNQDEAVMTALAHNPDVAAAEAAAHAAEAAVRAAKSDYRPSVAAFGDAGTVRDEFFPGYKADSATVGVRMRWSLFDSGRTSAKVREVQANVRAAQARVQSARLQVEAATLTAWAQVRATRLALDAAERQQAAAEGAVHDAGLEVKAGAKPLLGLLDAERDLYAANAALAAARGDALKTAWQLKVLTQ
jgi:outer membrane protein